MASKKVLPEKSTAIKMEMHPSLKNKLIEFLQNPSNSEASDFLANDSVRATYLDLSNINIKQITNMPKLVENLGASLQKNHHITSLDLSGNFIRNGILNNILSRLYEFIAGNPEKAIMQKNATKAQFFALIIGTPHLTEVKYDRDFFSEKENAAIDTLQQNKATGAKRQIVDMSGFNF
jgi:hypothetical protein